MKPSIIEFVGGKSKMCMELEQLPADVLGQIVDWMDSKTRSVVCPVSKKMYGLALKLLKQDLTYKSANDIVLLNDYHLFVRMYTRRDVIGIERLLGCAARVCNVDLLEIFIEGKLPLSTLDYTPAGMGGDAECIKMITDYAAQLNAFVQHNYIAIGAAATGHIALVRELIPKLVTGDYLMVMVGATQNLLCGKEIVGIFMDELGIVDEYTLGFTAESTINYNNIDCLKFMIGKGVIPALEKTGTCGNIDAFKILAPYAKYAESYDWTFDNACHRGYMEFIGYMLENYRNVIDVAGGFWIMNLKYRIAFMEKCLELGVDFNADDWFICTYGLRNGPGDVCEWMARHPAIKLSERIWLEYGAGTEEKWAKHGEKFREAWKCTERALRERRESDEKSV